MRYFVREELDKPIKGEYNDIGLAISAMSVNDQIYNEEGKLVVAKGDIMIQDYTFNSPITNYMKAWNDLKTHYKNELHIIKMSEPEGYIGTKMTELLYSSIIKKMEEIETKNTKVIGGN